MPLTGYLLTLISGLAIALFAILQYRKSRQLTSLIVQLAAVAFIFAAVLHFFGLPSTLRPKGPEEDQNFEVAVAAIYVSIVLGMLAEGFYSWLDKPGRRRKFEWGATVKPLFVSPILLIPTIAAFQNAKIDLMELDFPRLMILLTAFEKGFLWRHYLAKATESAKAKGQSETTGKKVAAP
jgi:hypothetical protein